MQFVTAAKFSAFGIAALVLVGCVESTDTKPSMRSGSMEDENACLAAVARQTNNSVSVISSDFSQANTMVMVGVGPQRAPWRCLVSGGQVAEVMSMVDEGAL